MGDQMMNLIMKVRPNLTKSQRILGGRGWRKGPSVWGEWCLMKSLMSGAYNLFRRPMIEAYYAEAWRVVQGGYPPMQVVTNEGDDGGETETEEVSYS
jgi:hypothetical protein